MHTHTHVKYFIIRNMYNAMKGSNGGTTLNFKEHVRRLLSPLALISFELVPFILKSREQILNIFLPCGGFSAMDGAELIRHLLQTLFPSGSTLDVTCGQLYVCGI